MRHVASSSSCRRVLAAFAGLGLAALAACGGDDKVGGHTDTPAADTAPDTTPTPDTQQEISFDTTPDTTAPDTSTPLDTASDTSLPPDTSAPDADADADAGPDTTGCGTFGCACTGNGDCLDGYCIEGADGRVCTRKCVTDCPDGFDCFSVSLSGGDPENVCVPSFTRLCRPCQVDADCQAPSDGFPAYCIPAADPGNGSFCAASCASRECPEGFSCDDVTTMAGGTAKECVPESGECTCHPAWSALGLVTDCEVRNAFGECPGTRTCGANGLTACNGPQANPELCNGVDDDCDGETDNIPAVACLISNGFGSCPGTTACGDNHASTCVGTAAAAETCNGHDDDCDGQTDESSCDDQLVCTNDTCHNGSECTHDLISGTCLINGQCYQNGAFNPLDSCEICDASRSTVTWSQTANTCVIAGMCFGNGVTNPADNCQVCKPGQSTTAWTTATNTCQIAGQCYQANDLDPADACQICVPSTSTTAWTQAFNTCNIQGQCVAAGGKKPGEPCVVCDPSRNATGWSNVTQGGQCDDGSPCSTDDHCDGAGSCVGNTSCDDGIACTDNTCTATGCDNSQISSGTCRIGGTCRTDGFTNPDNQCQNCASGATQASRTSWTNKGSGIDCSDGLACTVGDHCDGGGGCVSGAPKSCADAFSCTSDTCSEPNGACSSSLQSGKCIIGGACFNDNDAQAGNTCYECEPSVSTGGWTFESGKSCNDGNECTTTDTCSGSACSGSYIKDNFEPNDTEATAYNLGNYSDSDNWPERTEAQLTLYGPNDVDWYQYFVDDGVGGDIEPRVSVTHIPTGEDFEMCIYFHCTSEDKVPSNLDCGGAGGYGGGSITVGGKQYNGCCMNHAGNADEDMKFDSSTFSDSEMECPGGDDDFRAFVRVRNVTSNYTCNSKYTLSIGDD